MCGGHHQAECGADAVLHGRGIGLACPEKQELCCYIGQEQQVRRAMEELALRVEKEKAGGEEAFTDNVIMYEVLSELKDIAARDGISCTCGSHKYSMAVRRGACLETPHVMMLADDPACTLIEPIGARKNELRKVYEGELMQGGGHIAGWAVEDPAMLAQIDAALAALGSQEAFDAKYPQARGAKPLTLAVGDGNHSLAAAKACWEELKATLTPEERESHPARWCLAEVCNVHSPAIEIEPIHRVLFNVDCGAVLLALLEWSNPRTMGGLSVPGKIMAALFQSVSTRTAGMNTIDLEACGPVTKLWMSILQFIGAAPGSTGGGVKVTTIAVVILTIRSVAQGRDDCVIHDHHIESKTIYRALTIIVIGAVAAFGSAVVVYYNTAETVSVIDCIFESCSAFGTVGLSVGVTGQLNTGAKLLYMACMFMGRVGPVSLAISLTAKPDDNLSLIHI